MAAIARRPRLPLHAALAASLVLAACSLLKPVQAPVSQQERAQHLAQTGQHAEAAQAYAELAGLLPAKHDNYELLSAEQWLAAGNIAAAKQSFAAVSADARIRLPTARALVAAEIAFAENDGARAIRELDQIPVPTTAGSGAELLVDSRPQRLHHRTPGRRHARPGRARALAQRSRRPARESH